MRYVEIAGQRLSVIGLGTWQFGSREWGYGDQYAEGEALDITRRALDLGINVVDSAEVYAFGRSERIVGRAIQGRRDDVFLATKIFPILALAPVVRKRARASADRLMVDAIDLYQVHWPNPLVPLSSTMKGMAALQAEGTVTHVGVSNFNLKQWQQAERALGGPVLTNQVEYNLVARKPERELLAWAQANDRAIIAYSPLAQGFLSGRYDAHHLPTGLRSTRSLFLPENLDRARPLLVALREIAGGHGATPAQIALAWLIHRPNVIAIPGASSVAQLEANAAAADITLSADDDQRLTEASDAFHRLPATTAARRRLGAMAQRGRLSLRSTET